jgi:hypothetical protein
LHADAAAGGDSDGLVVEAVVELEQAGTLATGAFLLVDLLVQSTKHFVLEAIAVQYAFQVGARLAASLRDTR